MNVNKLVYYSESSDATAVFFQALGLELKVINSDDNNKKGLYLLETKYGRNFEKKLATKISGLDLETESLLIYKALSSVELENIKRLVVASPQLEIYILAHKLFNLANALGELRSTEFKYSNLKLLCSADGVRSLALSQREIIELQIDLRMTTLITLSINQDRLTHQTGIKLSSPPFVLMFLMKVFLSPWLECKKAFVALKLIQLLWVKRLLELVDLIFYVLLSVYYPTKYFLVLILPYPVYKVYWFFSYQYKTRIKKQIWTE